MLEYEEYQNALGEKRIKINKGEFTEMNQKTTTPKLMIATDGIGTYAFLDEKCISDGIIDLKYSALDEAGKLRPTLDMKIDVNSFSLEKGMSIEEFLERSTELKDMFQQPDLKKEPLELKEQI